MKDMSGVSWGAAPLAGAFGALAGRQDVPTDSAEEFQPTPSATPDEAPEEVPDEGP
jgi:hypothetical protein